MSQMSIDLDAAVDKELREREREVAYEQRRPSSLAALTAIIAVLCWLPSIGWVHRVVGVTSTDMVVALGTFLGVFVSTTVVLHWKGFDSLAFTIIERFETLTTSSVGAYLVYCSGTAHSVFCLVPLGLAGVQATAAQSPGYNAFALVAPMSATALAFWLVDGKPGEAVACAIVIAVLVGFFAMIGRTPVKLARATAERDILMRRMAAMQLDAERTRIARDLHDGVGADLTALVLTLRSIREDMGGEPVTAEIDAVVERASRGMEDLRGVVWALRTDDGSWQELIEHLRAAGRGLTRGGPRFQLSVDGDIPEAVLTGAQRLHLLRLVQEAVRNAVRHALAESIGVRLTFENDGSLLVEVTDDGVGISQETFEASTRGLANLRARAAALGGTLERVESPRGTHLRARLNDGASNRVTTRLGQNANP